MDGKFDVTLHGQKIGTVEVKQEGLYCRLSCRCRIVEGEIHRLWAGGEKIGVLIPEKGMLALDTKVTAKRLQNNCRFTLGEYRGNFYPICPGAPFVYLHKLRSGRLEVRDGIYGLTF